MYGRYLASFELSRHPPRRHRCRHAHQRPGTGHRHHPSELDLLDVHRLLQRSRARWGLDCGVLSELGGICPANVGDELGVIVFGERCIGQYKADRCLAAVSFS